MTTETIGILGLGYVGLPLCLAFAQHCDVVGYDIKPGRADELSRGEDHTGEADLSAISTTRATFTDKADDLAVCNVYIFAVPTPITKAHQPDLSPIEIGIETIAPLLKKGDLVILESTVYPGLTEELVGPKLEALSGLKCGIDFHLGYSPERVNPGDKNHRLDNTMRIVSGQDTATLARVAALYRLIVNADLHEAPSIRVAEAAKVIENTQRDLNIALVNELAVIFNKLGIDSEDVLKAAETKWNFLPFRPGLVGGHCIGVDPYYLTHKAEMIGHHPEVILAGRRVNDGMGAHVAHQLIKAMLQARFDMKSSRILLMGLTFKENCPDLRNTKAIDIYNTLSDCGLQVDVWDPQAVQRDATRLYGLDLVTPDKGAYDAIVLAVAHREFRAMSLEDVRALGRDGALLYDLKYVFEKHESDLRL